MKISRVSAGMPTPAIQRTNSKAPAKQAARTQQPKEKTELNPRDVDKTRRFGISRSMEFKARFGESIALRELEAEIEEEDAMLEEAMNEAADRVEEALSELQEVEELEEIENPEEEPEIEELDEEAAEVEGSGDDSEEGDYADGDGSGDAEREELEQDLLIMLTPLVAALNQETTFRFDLPRRILGAL